MTAEQSLFHPVLAARDLPAHSPVAVVLLGQRLALWRDELGQAHAFLDKCPHRGASLSLGQIVTVQGRARLQCVYHGWQFDASARCQHVPAQPAWVPPEGHCAKRFVCAESQGMVWVRLVLDVDGNAVPTAFKLDPGLDWTIAISGPYTVKTSAPRLVENFLDMTHFGFVHDGFLGDVAHTELAAYDVEENEAPGAKPVVVPDCAVWQPNAFESGNDAGGGGQTVRYRYEVLAPYTATLDKLGEQGRLFIAMLNCPMGDEQTTTWFWIAASGLNQTPQQLTRFQDVIFAQDLAVVESQYPKTLPLSHIELHGPLDRVSAAYRRYLKRVGVHTGVIP